MLCQLKHSRKRLRIVDLMAWIWPVFVQLMAIIWNQSLFLSVYCSEPPVTSCAHFPHLLDTPILLLCQIVSIGASTEMPLISLNPKLDWDTGPCDLWGCLIPSCNHVALLINALSTWLIRQNAKNDLPRANPIPCNTNCSLVITIPTYPSLLLRLLITCVTSMILFYRRTLITAPLWCTFGSSEPGPHPLVIWMYEWSWCCSQLGSDDISRLPLDELTHVSLSHIWTLLSVCCHSLTVVQC